MNYVTSADTEVWCEKTVEDAPLSSVKTAAEHLWNEGERVRCPDCAHEFVTPNGVWQASRKVES